MEEAIDNQWQALSEEILSGMKEWRLAHPNATFREIEQAASERVSRLQARIVQDTAMNSALANCQDVPKEQRPVCPTCAQGLIPRGKHTRRLQCSGGLDVELKRSYGACPSCGMGFF